MEATFPFSALERKQHFALAVKIAKPFRMFGVGKMRPYVVVNTIEPFKAFLATGELVALDHGDERLDVNPPEFLVPFELLARMAEAVHEIEDAAVLLVPSVVGLVEGGVNGFLNEVLTAEALAEVHDKPHGFNGVARIEKASVEAVNKFVVGREVFHDEAQFGTVENVHDLVNARVDGLLHEGRVEQRFDFQSHVAENHREGEAL